MYDSNVNHKKRRNALSKSTIPYSIDSSRKYKDNA